MTGPMPSFAPGSISSTAIASKCASEWRILMSLSFSMSLANHSKDKRFFQHIPISYHFFHGNLNMDTPCPYFMDIRFPEVGLQKITQIVKPPYVRAHYPPGSI